MSTKISLKRGNVRILNDVTLIDEFKYSDDIGHKQFI